MLPFIHVFGVELPMYGILMITGATLAILFACLSAGRKGLERLDVLLAAIFAFLGGLLGAKLLFIITDIPNMVTYFKANGFSLPWLFQRMASAGIVFYGGLIGGFFGGWVYTRLFRLDFWKHADAMIPFLPLAHAFGRLGCFCAGCCYGRQMDPPWGLYFNNAIGAPHNIPLFPVQLLEACFNLIILFPIIQLYSRKERKPGQIVGLYLVCYGIFRFFNEYLRSDEIRGIFLGVSTSQWVSIVLVPIGLLLLSAVFSDVLGGKRRRQLAAYYENGDETDDFCGCAICTECGECTSVKDAAADKDTGALDEAPAEEPDPEALSAEELEQISEKSDVPEN